MNGGLKGAILGVLLLLSSAISAQEPSAIELEKKLNSVQGSERGAILAQLTEAYRSEDPQKAIQYGRQALSVLQVNFDPASQVTALCEMGWAYLMMSQYQKAFEYIENGRQIAETNEDNAGLSRALNNLGMICNRLGDQKKALDYLNQSLELRKSLESKRGIASTLNNIGEIYRDLGQYEKTLEVNQQSLKIWKEIGDKAGEAISLKNVGEAFLNLGQLDLAEKNLTEGLHLSEQQENRSEQVLNLLSLSALKRKRGQYGEAETFATKALKLATGLPGKEMIGQAYQELAAAQEGVGDYSAALESHKKFKEINDSIFNDDRARRLALLKDSYNLGKRMQEIDKLKKDRAVIDLKLQKQSFRQNALLAIGIFLAILGFVIHRKRIEAAHIREKLSLKDPLTGLPNRRFVSMTIDHDVANSLRKHQDAIKAGTSPQYADLIFSVINLDDFKKINDEYDHSAGVQVLSQIGSLLQASCRATDTIVRWGEEEFLIISRFSNREAASLIAERFRKLIENTVLQIGNEEFRVTCSIGFAAYPFVPSSPEAFTWEQVIAFANRSLAASKRSGRNAWVGLLATKKGNSKDFDARDFANLRKCIDQGELSVITSLPTSSIQW
ncbi:diguanylate cyclase [bacterium]|nr:diguanylate cyclase [bacterium]